MNIMIVRIESDYKLNSDSLPDAIFGKVSENKSEAVAIAIKGIMSQKSRKLELLILILARLFAEQPILIMGMATNIKYKKLKYLYLSFLLYL